MRVTGWIDREQVRAEVLTAHALVVLSCAGGPPVAITEAMAVRQWVVARHSVAFAWLEFAKLFRGDLPFSASLTP